MRNLSHSHDPNADLHSVPFFRESDLWGKLRGRLKSETVSEASNGDQAVPQLRREPLRGPVRPLLPHCRGLNSTDLAFLATVLQTLANLVPIDPGWFKGPDVALIFRGLLSGQVPSPSAFAVMKGELPCVGGFTLRSSRGGNTLDLVVFVTDSQGKRRLLGEEKAGTVFQCGWKEVLHSRRADYPEALRIIREVIEGGGVYLCECPGGWYGYSVHEG